MFPKLEIGKKNTDFTSTLCLLTLYVDLILYVYSILDLSLGNY